MADRKSEKGTMAMAVQAEDGNHSSSTAARLEEMGYKEELRRNLGMVSVLGLSFAIMAVPFGTSTTLNTALTDGGPVTVFWGWLFVSLVSLCMAASLAEICSVFPTSGGVYCGRLVS